MRRHSISLGRQPQVLSHNKITPEPPEGAALRLCQFSDGYLLGVGVAVGVSVTVELEVAVAEGRPGLGLPASMELSIHIKPITRLNPSKINGQSSTPTMKQPVASGKQPIFWMACRKNALER
jgi:hypothetical protein